VRTDGSTAMMLASGNGHAEVVLVLLQRGADAARIANNGDTARSLAKERAVMALLSGAGGRRA